MNLIHPMVQFHPTHTVIVVEHCIIFCVSWMMIFHARQTVLTEPRHHHPHQNHKKHPHAIVIVMPIHPIGMVQSVWPVKQMNIVVTDMFVQIILVRCVIVPPILQIQIVQGPSMVHVNHVKAEQKQLFLFQILDVLTFVYLN